jgi:hypothetical protein
VVSAQGARPLFFVSDHGVMRTASVLVCGDGPDRFESPKGPLLPRALGALVAASSRALTARTTVLDAAVAILDRVHDAGVRLEVLGRWEGVLGARFDAGNVGPLCFVWQRPEVLTFAVASRAPSSRLVVPTEERSIATLDLLAEALPEIARAIAAAR